MTRDEMSKIIDQALRTYCGPLPDYITNAIVAKQPKTGPLDTLMDQIAGLRERLKSAEHTLEVTKADREYWKARSEQPHTHDDNPVIIALRKEIRQHLDTIERLTATRCEMKREIERLKGTVKEWMESFTALKEEQRKLGCDLEREKASNLDLKSKLEELTGVADEFEKENQTLRNDRDVAMRKLEEARAAQPHFYNPSTQHMGDCTVCGMGQFAPQHDVAQWKARAEKCELHLQDWHQMHDSERDRRRDADRRAEHLRDKLDKAEAIIDATKKALLP